MAETVSSAARKFRADGINIGEYMLKDKITRKEFFKMTGLAIFTVFLLPGLKKLNLLRKPHREAKYYKKLAG